MAWNNIRDTGFEWSIKNLKEILELINFFIRSYNFKSNQYENQRLLLDYV